MRRDAILVWHIVLACLAFPTASLSADPDCTAPDRWQTMSTLVKLEAAGLIRAADLDRSRTKTVRLASEKVSASRYRQIHETIFFTRTGKAVRVITSSIASSDECSESSVEVFVISEHLSE